MGLETQGQFSLNNPVAPYYTSAACYFNSGQKKCYTQHTSIWYNAVFGKRKNKGFAVRKVDKDVAQKRQKASTRKASSAKTAKANLTAEDIERFKQILLKKRRDIVGDVKEMKDEALKQSLMDASGDLSSMPIHMADLGTDTYEQEFTLELMDSERKLLKEIDDALARINQKTYGICEATEKPIAQARLEAKPWARYCVEYARMIEQGLETEPEEAA